MLIDPEEVRRRFDGTHHLGSLTFYTAGAHVESQLIGVFLEATRKTEITRVEYQMTATEAMRLINALVNAILDLSPDPDTPVN